MHVCEGYRCTPALAYSYFSALSWLVYGVEYVLQGSRFDLFMPMPGDASHNKCTVTVTVTTPYATKKNLVELKFKRSNIQRTEPPISKIWVQTKTLSELGTEPAQDSIAARTTS